jgi:hypothetical protein
MHWHSDDTGLKIRSAPPFCDGVSLSPLEPNVMFGSLDRKLKRRCVKSTGSRSTIFAPEMGLSAAPASGAVHARHTTAMRIRRFLFTGRFPLCVRCFCPAPKAGGHRRANAQPSAPVKCS